MKKELDIKDLAPWLHKYKQMFGEPVPTNQILPTTSIEHLIESIQKCLNDGIDYLPQIYGYDDVDPGTLY